MWLQCTVGLKAILCSWRDLALFLLSNPHLSSWSCYSYCRCCQLRTALPRQTFTRPLTSRLRSLVRRVQGHIPRVLMFGSGLESVPLVRTLLWEDASPYRPIGLHPGKDGRQKGYSLL